MAFNRGVSFKINTPLRIFNISSIGGILGRAGVAYLIYTSSLILSARRWSGCLAGRNEPEDLLLPGCHGDRLPPAGIRRRRLTVTRASARLEQPIRVVALPTPSSPSDQKEDFPDMFGAIGEGAEAELGAGPIWNSLI